MYAQHPICVHNPEHLSEAEYVYAYFTKQTEAERVRYLPECTQQKPGKARIRLGVCKTPNHAALTLLHPLGPEL